MSRDICLLLIGAVFSGLISWLITHVYYKKSLRQQEGAAKIQIGILTKALELQNKNDSSLFRQKRIEECIAEHKRAGTPDKVIDTYTELNNQEKAEILDAVLLRIKGRPAKNNKYREGKNT